MTGGVLAGRYRLDRLIARDGSATRNLAESAFSLPLFPMLNYTEGTYRLP